MLKTYNITLNLDKPTNTTNIIVKRKDDMSRRLIFHIMSNNQSVGADEIESISVKAIKPDGTVVYDEVRIEDDRIYYDLIEQFTAVAGEVECELEIYGKEKGVLCSPNFYLTVQANVYDTDTIVSKNILQGLQNYVSAAYDALRQTQEMSDAFQLSYGTLEEIQEELEGVRETYVTYIDTLKKRVADGEFNGERGLQGEKGADAVLTEAVGLIGFQIVEGQLICYYYDDVPPLEIDDDGHLIYRKE